MKLKYTRRSTQLDSDYLPNRVLVYWNKIPGGVKSAESVNAFKARLAAYKDRNQDQQGNYWELSDEIFNRLHD